MSKLYAKYRKTAFNRGQWLYTLSYLYNQERQWYIDNKWVSIEDTAIPDNMYIDASKWRRLAICNYTADEAFTEADFTTDIESYAQNATRILAVADAQAFVDENTDPTKLIKESVWVYYYTYEDMEWVEQKKYINID